MAKPIVLGVAGYAADLVRGAGAGICIEPENEGELIDAVTELARDPALARRLGQAGFEALAGRSDEGGVITFLGRHGEEHDVSLAEIWKRAKDNQAALEAMGFRPGGRAVVPAPVPPDTECLIAAVSSIGRLLMFEMDELPELAKGKGNKLINIPTKKYQSGEEKLVAAAVVPEEGNLQVYSGSRMMTIRWDDSDPYYGERALRGGLLPRGWRTVDRLVGIAPE